MSVGEAGPEEGGKVQDGSKDEGASQSSGGTEEERSPDGVDRSVEEERTGGGGDGDEEEIGGVEPGVGGEEADVEAGSDESGRNGGEGDDDIPFAAEDVGDAVWGEVGSEDGGDFEGDQEAAEAELDEGEVGSEDGADFEGDQEAAEAELDEDEVGGAYGVDFEGEQEAAKAGLDENDVDDGDEGAAGDGAGAGDGVRVRPDPRTQGLAPEGDVRLSETLRVGLLGVEAQLSQVAGALSTHSAVVERLETGTKGENKAEVENEEGDGEEAGGAALKALSESVDQSISAMVAAVERQSEAFGGVNVSVDVVKKVGEAISGVVEALSACQADLSRQRELDGRVRRWTLLVAVALGGPALLLAGTFAGQRWEVLPMQDATGGWRDHVWERYGEDLVGCVRRGLREGSSFECVIDVRGSVENVRGSGSRR